MRRIGAAIVVLALGALGSVALAAPGSRPVFGRQLVAEQGSGLVLLRPDGSGITPLVRRGSSPAWSPDGRQIAFIRSVNRSQLGRRGHSLYVVGRDGRNSRRIATIRPRDSFAFFLGRSTWAPNGRRLAYPVSVPSETSNCNYEDQGERPQIVFDCTWEVHVVGADGRADRAIFRPPGNGSIFPDRGVSWSRDDRIAVAYSERHQVCVGCPLASGPSAGRDTASIIVLDPSGDLTAVIPTTVEQIDSLQWAPDGQRIVYAGYVSALDGALTPEVHVVDVERPVVSDVVVTPAGYVCPSIGPDGRSLVVTSWAEPGTVGSPPGLYRARLDRPGSLPRRITSTGHAYTCADWAGGS